MPDADTPGALAALLIANRGRREAAAEHLSAAKEELRSLILRGHAISMEVTEMSSQAGISRDTSHRVIREAGAMSWKEKRAWAHEVLSAIPSDKSDIGQQSFRSAVEMSLYSALGSKRDKVPPSLETILKSATETVREVGDREFEPRIDHDRLAQLSPWPVEPFEILQTGVGGSATFQLRRNGVELAPRRKTAEEVARDLKQHGGKRPTYIDRTGPECTTTDGARISWSVLKTLD